MTISILSKHLNELINILDCKYNVNNGGCAYIAYCIARNFEAKGISFKVILYDDFKGNSAKSNFSTNTSVAHVFIKTNKSVINSAGYSFKNTFIINATASQLYKYYKKGRWNNTYNVRYNSIISREINKFFNNI